MSDIARNETTPSLLLDGDLPRLGSAQPIVPVPVAPVMAATPGGAPTLPVVSPVLKAPAAAPGMGGLATLPPALPEIPADPALPTLPSLPAPAATSAPTLSVAGPTAESDTAPRSQSTSGGTPRHPMAHLMPEKAAPSEASRRAAEQRAAKKAKAKKIKLGAAAGMLVLAAVVGPPLGKWVADALDQAGSTTTEEPAPAPAPTTAPAGAIDAANQVVDKTNQQANPTP